ncbi:MAG: ABC transporter substrate-binding protein, partial [Chloroflexi bacterium]|nr:ABC transporter substrate-binding protein [Chloroflexota bacterium]
DARTVEAAGGKVYVGRDSSVLGVTLILTRLPEGHPLRDKRVRQALNYAVDKDGIIKSVLFGLAQRSTAPIAPEFFGYTKIGGYDYDPAKAKQLLQEAGATNLSLKIIHPTGRYLQDAQATQAIGGNLRDVGVTVETTTSDWPTYLATVLVTPEKVTLDGYFVGLASYFLDAVHATTVMSKRGWPPNGFGASHYSNPRVEELLDRAAADVNRDAREKAYHEALRIVWDDAPWIFLWEQKFPIVHSAKVKGIGSLPIEKFQAVYAEPA